MLLTKFTFTVLYIFNEKNKSTCNLPHSVPTHVFQGSTLYIESQLYTTKNSTHYTIRPQQFLITSQMLNSLIQHLNKFQLQVKFQTSPLSPQNEPYILGNPVLLTFLSAHHELFPPPHLGSHHSFHLKSLLHPPIPNT